MDERDPVQSLTLMEAPSDISGRRAEPLGGPRVRLTAIDREQPGGGT